MMQKQLLLVTDVTQIEKNDWSASVPACHECRFDAKKRSRDIEVEFYRTLFRAPHSWQAGRSRSSPLRNIC